MTLRSPAPAAEPPPLPARRAMLGALACLGAWPAGAYAARREATLLTPISAGTTMDLLARQVAQTLQAAQTDYEVMNLPGGGGLPAAQRLLRSVDREHNLLLSHSGLMCVVPQLLKGPASFDPLTDFTALAILSRAPFVLYTSAGADMADIAAMRQRLTGTAAPVSYAVLALYGGDHLCGASLFQRLGIPAAAVAYKQAGQALLDVATRRVPFGIASWGNVQPLLRQGRLRVVSALSRQRLPFAPDLPALEEAGLADCAYEGWHGLFHRRDVSPHDFVDQARALEDWCRQPAYASALAELGYTPNYLPAQQAAGFVRAEVLRHQSLLRSLPLG